MKTYKALTQQIAEATKWKKGDGRPRNGSHIENVKFWDLPDASLKYIQKDAHDAMKANPKGKKAGKYADEVNDAATVLFWRKKNKIVVKDKEGFQKHQEEVELEEAKKLKASDIVKMMSDTEKWGSDAKARVYTKGSNFVYIDSFYFNAKKALDNLVTAWSKGGDYHKYFADEYGCDLKVVDSFEEMKATGKHKKLGKDGIVGVEIKIQ
jgi:uncharacterized protein YbjQ (UPF0145 family)